MEAVHRAGLPGVVPGLPRRCSSVRSSWITADYTVMSREISTRTIGPWSRAAFSATASAIPGGRARKLRFEEGRWKRHRGYATDCTGNIASWNPALAVMLGHAESRVLFDWCVSVNSTINRAHRHCKTSRAAQGSPSIDKNMHRGTPDHAIGRSGSGLKVEIP
ncbi:MAG: hypothetical protein WCC45_13135 [Paeniglutamicibacter sp.]